MLSKSSHGPRAEGRRTSTATRPPRRGQQGPGGDSGEGGGVWRGARDRWETVPPPEAPADVPTDPRDGCPTSLLSPLPLLTGSWAGTRPPRPRDPRESSAGAGTARLVRGSHDRRRPGWAVRSRRPPLPEATRRRRPRRSGPRPGPPCGIWDGTVRRRWRGHRSGSGGAGGATRLSAAPSPSSAVSPRAPPPPRWTMPPLLASG